MHRRRLLLICGLFLVCSLLPGLAQAPVERGALITRYQREANAMSWTWKDEEATPEHCAAELRGDGPYHVEIVYRNYRQRTIFIRDGKDALRYEIQRHAHATVTYRPLNRAVPTPGTPDMSILQALDNE